MLDAMVASDAQLQSDVLEDLATAKNYRRWIVELVEPWLGNDPIEVGSGLGDYAQEWASDGLHVTVSEADPARLAYLHRRFAGDANIAVRELTLPIDEHADHTAVVAINVLEHIEDDVDGLRAITRLVRPGGHVVVYVPAFMVAMSDFDRDIGHFRRYRRAELAEKFTHAGLSVEQIRYVNIIGLVAWTVLVRFAGRRPRQGLGLHVYDRFVIPVFRRLERRLSPPFGQSVFAVGRRN